MKHANGDYDLQLLIKSVEHVHATYRPASKVTYFYSDHPEQQHLIQLVNKQRPHRYSPKRRPSYSSPPFNVNYKRQRTFYRTSKPATEIIMPIPTLASSPIKHTKHEESHKSIASEASKDDSKSIKNESNATIFDDNVSK